MRGRTTYEEHGRPSAQGERPRSPKDVASGIVLPAAEGRAPPVASEPPGIAASDDGESVLGRGNVPNIVGKRLRPFSIFRFRVWPRT